MVLSLLTQCAVRFIRTPVVLRRHDVLCASHDCHLLVHEAASLSWRLLGQERQSPGVERRGLGESGIRKPQAYASRLRLMENWDTALD